MRVTIFGTKNVRHGGEIKGKRRSKLFSTSYFYSQKLVTKKKLTEKKNIVSSLIYILKDLINFN